MNTSAELEDALTLALRLAPRDRLKLIERVAASVEDALSTPHEPPATEHWGQSLLRLLDEIGPIELVHPEIEDPVEWLKTLRRDGRERRLGELGKWGEALDMEDRPE